MRTIIPNFFELHKDIYRTKQVDENNNFKSFKNDDQILYDEANRTKQLRNQIGLNGLIFGLDSIIINVELNDHKAACLELLSNTGYYYENSFETHNDLYAVFSLKNSASILIKSYKNKSVNPFIEFNKAPKTESKPNARLETFVFETDNIKKVFEVQFNRGVKFLTEKIIENQNFLFIQTIPSSFTGNSIAYIQWKSKIHDYSVNESEKLYNSLDKPNLPFLKNIGRLDHTASRVKAYERDAAIIEFMELTNYNFDFSIYVKSLNSITNVARITDTDFAMVFTSGISPFKSMETSGPTELFIHNYNTRVHHAAFETKNIENTFEKLKENGQEFLLELVGNQEDGLKQTFTKASPYSLLVNEYIRRYDDFTGFFTKSNVKLLTESTYKQ